MLVPLMIGLAAIIWLTWIMRASLVAARMFQIEEYEAPRLLAWGRQRAWLWSTATLIASAGTLILGLFTLVLSTDLRRIGLGISWLVGALLLQVLWKSLPAKRSLVYTARMRRILGTGLVLTLLLTSGLVSLILMTPLFLSTMIVLLSLLLAPSLVLLLIVGSNILLGPVEAQVRRRFVRRARSRLTMYNPLVIGIAGSYGKTSTKHILAQLLAPQKETLPTPKSFNTLMGISRTINECLQPKHELFIVEMDAYQTGEITRMCELVKPQVGVITSVGPQHLERFGSMERIANALYELVASLPPASPAVIYAGERMSAHLAERAAQAGYRVVRYGLASEQSGPCDIVASDIVIDEYASHFTWRWPAEGLEFRVSLPLLGRHNILNVSAALAVVHLLGLPVAQAVCDAIHLEPAPHRLQRLPSTGGITVIDDSYNANPVGVHNGLDVLAQMPGRAKILVTPGMVELGSVEEAENMRFGKHAAQVCQHVILVGVQQTKPILAGLQESGFSPEQIHVVNTLKEVTTTLSQIAKSGDVVLFANDLPDTYLELKT
jgi:UDP-N-acetylmuramoyl-tripeptide--D-alanyl-D-alanine ligase